MSFSAILAFRSLMALFMTGLLAGCALPGVNDLRLEGVRRPTPELLADLNNDYMAPRIDIGVVAELSTTTDLRHRIGADAAAFHAIVVRCEGRSHIPDEHPIGPLIAAADLRDRHGPLYRRARGDETGARHTYWLPIALVTTAHDSRLTSTGAGRSWSVAHDLRRDTEDLCLYLRGTTHFILAIWRSNTIVIPREAVRAALAGTPH